MSEAKEVVREIEKVVDQHRTFLSQKDDDSRLDVLDKWEAKFVEEQNLMGDISALLESRAERAHGNDFRNDTPLASPKHEIDANGDGVDQSEAFSTLRITPEPPSSHTLGTEHLSGANLAAGCATSVQLTTTASTALYGAQVRDSPFRPVSVPPDSAVPPLSLDSTAVNVPVPMQVPQVPQA